MLSTFLAGYLVGWTSFCVLAQILALRGAARLARIGIDGGALADLCPVPAAIGEFVPDPARQALLARRRTMFHRLYAQLRPLYAELM